MDRQRDSEMKDVDELETKHSGGANNAADRKLTRAVLWQLDTRFVSSGIFENHFVLTN